MFVGLVFFVLVGLNVEAVARLSEEFRLMFLSNKHNTFDQGLDDLDFYQAYQGQTLYF